MIATVSLKQHLLSRMVGLFFWRIFLNFLLKSLGGNGSRGELARWPRTTSSSSSGQFVSLPAPSSKDMLDGRKPVDLLIVPLKESSVFFPPLSFNFLFFCVSLLKLYFPLSAANSSHAKMSLVFPGYVSWCVLTSALVREVQASNVHELGRYWITRTAPPLFSKKGKKAEKRGAKSWLKRVGEVCSSDRSNIPACSWVLNKYPVFVLKSTHQSLNRTVLLLIELTCMTTSLLTPSLTNKQIKAAAKHLHPLLCIYSQ